MPPGFKYFVQCLSAAFGSEKSANADASVIKSKDPSLRDFKDPRDDVAAQKMRSCGTRGGSFFRDDPLRPTGCSMLRLNIFLAIRHSGIPTAYCLPLESTVLVLELLVSSYFTTGDSS